jgi:hypothetical protein
MDSLPLRLQPRRRETRGIHALVLGLCSGRAFNRRLESVLRRIRMLQVVNGVLLYC